MPIVGKSYGCLTVIEVLDRRLGTGRSRCICTCHREVTVNNTQLLDTKNRSCNRQHSFINYLAYRSWYEMKRRCQNPNHSSYKDYGGRGITVCKRWDESFSNFLADMGERPSKNHTIDRIDNNKGYEPGNCRWGTRYEQANNTRRNNNLTYQGKTQTLKQWAVELGINYGTLSCRIRRGWTVEKAFTK